jgi:hypothetical protein
MHDVRDVFVFAQISSDTAGCSERISRPIEREFIERRLWEEKQALKELRRNRRCAKSCRANVRKAPLGDRGRHTQQMRGQATRRCPHYSKPRLLNTTTPSRANALLR